LDKIKRRAARKKARETREKDMEKDKMRREITKFMVEKGGTLQSEVAHSILTDVHGCYIKGQPFLGALGGQIQQWYYVIAAIKKVYENDDMRSYYDRIKVNPQHVKAASPKELI